MRHKRCINQAYCVPLHAIEERVVLDLFDIQSPILRCDESAEDISTTIQQLYFGHHTAGSNLQLLDLDGRHPGTLGGIAIG